jgi:hypothetical protein
MKQKKKNNSRAHRIQAYCHYCGALVGEISDRTDELVKAVYDCLKCRLNYCDQCTYAKKIDGELVQLCLRCDNKLEKVT